MQWTLEIWGSYRRVAEMKVFRDVSLFHWVNSSQSIEESLGNPRPPGKMNYDISKHCGFLGPTQWQSNIPQNFNLRSNILPEVESVGKKMYIFKTTTDWTTSALSWNTSRFQPHKLNNTAFSHYTTLFKPAVSAETKLLQACSQRYKLKTPNKQLGNPTEHLTVVHSSHRIHVNITNR